MTFGRLCAGRRSRGRRQEGMMDGGDQAEDAKTCCKSAVITDHRSQTYRRTHMPDSRKARLETRQSLWTVMPDAAGDHFSSDVKSLLLPVLLFPRHRQQEVLYANAATVLNHADSFRRHKPLLLLFSAVAHTSGRRRRLHPLLDSCISVSLFVFSLPLSY